LPDSLTRDQVLAIRQEQRRIVHAIVVTGVLEELAEYNKNLDDEHGLVDERILGVAREILQRAKSDMADFGEGKLCRFGDIDHRVSVCWELDEYSLRVMHWEAKVDEKVLEAVQSLVHGAEREARQNGNRRARCW
jgi:hypothetical protein